MLAGQLRGRNAPDQGGPSTVHLVCGHLLAVAGTTENDAEHLDAELFVAHDRTSSIDAEAWVVVERLERFRTMVEDLVPGIPEVLLQVFAEFETSVIGRDVDAHYPSLEAATDLNLRLRLHKIIRSKEVCGAARQQAGLVSSTTFRPSLSRTRTLLGVLLVLAVASIVGALTPIGEVLLPRSVNAAANSSGPWAIITFASVSLANARGWVAAVLGAASFVAMDLSFFVVTDALGGYYPHVYLAFWLLVGVVVGPLVGLCASWLRSPRQALVAVASAAPTSVLIGEGIFMLYRLPGVSTLYAVASVGVGCALFLVLALSRLRRFGWVITSAVMCVAASVLFFAIYGLLPLVLHKTVP